MLFEGLSALASCLKSLSFLPNEYLLHYISRYSIFTLLPKESSDAPLSSSQAEGLLFSDVSESMGTCDSLKPDLIFYDYTDGLSFDKEGS